MNDKSSLFLCIFRPSAFNTFQINQVRPHLAKTSIHPLARFAHLIDRSRRWLGMTKGYDWPAHGKKLVKMCEHVLQSLVFGLVLKIGLLNQI